MSSPALLSAQMELTAAAAVAMAVAETEAKWDRLRTSAETRLLEMKERCVIGCGES